MKISPNKINICLARKGINAMQLKSTGMAYNTILRALRGEEVYPKTINKIAAALDVDVSEIMANEEA